MIEATDSYISFEAPDGATYHIARVDPNIYCAIEEHLRRLLNRPRHQLVTLADVEQFVGTGTGARWVFWRCLQATGWTGTEEDAGGLVRSFTQLVEIVAQLFDIDKGEEGDADPTRRRPTGSSYS